METRVMVPYVFSSLNTLCTAFLFYEFLINFKLEVQLFWKRRWTGASALFFLNRYLALASYVLILCEFLYMSDT